MTVGDELTRLPPARPAEPGEFQLTNTAGLPHEEKTLSLQGAIEYATKVGQGDTPCACEHRQLAAWLKELDFFRGLFGGTCREDVGEALEENEALLVDGFEDALVGYFRRFNSGPLALYNYEKCVEILVKRDGMSYEEAEEYLEFNTLGAWAGGQNSGFRSLHRVGVSAKRTANSSSSLFTVSPSVTQHRASSSKIR